MNLHEEITKLQTATKRGELPREVRLVKIEQLTEDYYAKTGEIPDVKALERLADLCLYEELTDDRPDKMTLEEYPIMSGEQEARRKEGKHRKRQDNPRIEVPLGIAENYGVDGRMHGEPTRRDRSKRENMFLDKEVRARNKERQKNYSDFTKVQPVTIYKIGD